MSLPNVPVSGLGFRVKGLALEFELGFRVRSKVILLFFSRIKNVRLIVMLLQQFTYFKNAFCQAIPVYGASSSRAAIHPDCNNVRIKIYKSDM